MLVAFFLAALVQTQADNRLPVSATDQIHLVSERTFTPAVGELEAIMAGGSLSGLPGVRCGGFTPPANFWRVNCLNDTSAGRIVAVREAEHKPKIIATFDYKLIFVSSYALHDNLVIRTLGIRGNGKAVQAEYFWKPPRTQREVRR